MSVGEVPPCSVYTMLEVSSIIFFKKQIARNAENHQKKKETKKSPKNGRLICDYLVRFVLCEEHESLLILEESFIAIFLSPRMACW